MDGRTYESWKQYTLHKQFMGGGGGGGGGIADTCSLNTLTSSVLSYHIHPN